MYGTINFIDDGKKFTLEQHRFKLINTGLNCAGSLIHGIFFFFTKYILQHYTIWSLVGWIQECRNSDMRANHNLYPDFQLCSSGGGRIYAPNSSIVLTTVVCIRLRSSRVRNTKAQMFWRKPHPEENHCWIQSRSRKTASSKMIMNSRRYCLWVIIRVNG